MNRFVVYREISLAYVLFDMLTKAALALFLHRRDAERAAQRLNARPVTSQRLQRLSPVPHISLARRRTGPIPRYVVRPGFHAFERIVVDRWTKNIVWGPHNFRGANHAARRLNG